MIVWSRKEMYQLHAGSKMPQELNDYFSQSFPKYLSLSGGGLQLLVMKRCQRYLSFGSESD